MVPEDGYMKSDKDPFAEETGEMDAILQGTLRMVVDKENETLVKDGKISTMGLFWDTLVNHESILNMTIKISRRKVLLKSLD